MRVFQINGGVFGSTGAVMFGISERAEAEGHTVVCASPITVTNRDRHPATPYYRIGTFTSRRFNVLLARITGLEGCFARVATARLIREIKRFSPDVLHIHSIHNSYLNIPMLFRYIKESGIPTVWTLHDCWAFTGHCPHFDMIGCGKWLRDCDGCPLYRGYPRSLTDNARGMLRRKKRWFSDVPIMTLVTPSEWLAGLVRRSFLGVYPLRVIHNGINLRVFRPTESDFRARYGLEGKFVLLGVAFGWGEKKGLDVFIELAGRLPEDCAVVLVGGNDEIDRRLPDGVVSIHRTENQAELAAVYTAADLFINPTREDNYPTVNMEAIACGTPVITFATGGSPEILTPETGRVVPKGDVEALMREIEAVRRDRPFDRERVAAHGQSFDGQHRFLQNVELYREIITQKK